jgi:Anaphase-promoting complex subunit 5
MSVRPTPYSISVCTLIALQSDPTSPLHQEFHPSEAAQQSLFTFLEKCVESDGEGWKGGSLIHAMSMLDFFSQLKSGDAGEPTMGQLCNLLLEYVTMATSSVDGLVDLMESLRHAVVTGIVDSNSAHGVFLRKICLGFDLLSFETMALLWSDMQREIKIATQALDEAQAKPATDNNNNNNNNNKPTLVNVQESKLDEASATHWPLSASQIEGALRNQCFQMFGTGEKTMSFEELEVHLRYVLSSDPELPAAQFLRFLNCVKHGERVGAMDALHRYFDYAIIQGSGSKRDNSAQGDILQFAAILLASTHHSFGDTALSRLATEEAIRVAQQSMDASCVAFALGWIFSSEQTGQAPGMNASANPNCAMSTSAADLLHRCSTRAVEGQIWPLAAGANLTKTRHHLLGVSESNQSHSLDTRIHRGLAEVAWNFLADASSHLGTEAAAGVVDRPTHVTNYKDVMHTLARQKLIAGGVYDYFGQSHLSGLQNYIALYCHPNQMLYLDVVSAIQNVARVSLYGSPSAILSCDFQGKALEDVMPGPPGGQSQGTPSLERTQCVYSDALLKNIACWKQFGPMDGALLLSTTLMLQEWAVRRGDFNHAKAFGAALQGYLHPRVHNYWQMMIDTTSVKCLMLTRQEKFEKAERLLQLSIERAKVNNLRQQHASLLLQLSLVHLDANPRQSTLALPPLLECLSLTDQHQMDGLHACALSVMAQVHFRMRNSTRAIALLKAALPSLLQTEHVWYHGEAYLTLANCRLQLAGMFVQKDGVGANDKKKLLRLYRSVVRDLKQSQHFFEKCHDFPRLKEVFYLQARVLHLLPGEQRERDRMSQAFVEVSKHLAAADRPIDGHSGVLNCLSSIAALEKQTQRTIPTLAT